MAYIPTCMLCVLCLLVVVRATWNYMYTIAIYRCACVIYDCCSEVSYLWEGRPSGLYENMNQRKEFVCIYTERTSM